MRAIDADALKRRAQKVAIESWKMKIETKVETVLNQFIDWIDEASTIQPEPKRGKWILVTDNNGQHFECNRCGEWRYHQEQKFCGECGAKMEEKT